MADSRNGSRATTPSTDLLRLARTYGITRDQARRLVKKFRNDPKKLDESAKVLSARSASFSRLPRASGEERIVGLASIGDAALCHKNRRLNQGRLGDHQSLG
jgi:hypothetical protein